MVQVGCGSNVNDCLTKTYLNFLSTQFLLIQEMFNFSCGCCMSTNANSECTHKTGFTHTRFTDQYDLALNLCT